MTTPNAPSVQAVPAPDDRTHYVGDCPGSHAAPCAPAPEQAMAHLNEEILRAFSIPTGQPKIDLTPYTCSWCGQCPERVMHLCVEPPSMRAPGRSS
jgi:hypothetical protein